MNERNEYAYIIHPPRTTFLDDATDAERQLVADHYEYLKSALAAGDLIFAGRCAHAKFGIVVFEAPDETSARRFMNDDPVVKAGLFPAEFHQFRTALIRGLACGAPT
jgi:uncharacterized protein YciI